MSSLYTDAPQGPLGPGQMAGGQGMPPQFPQSLAMQLMKQQAATRQQGGMGRQLMQTPLPQAPQMPSFSPTPLPPPTEFYGQKNAPSEGMRQQALQGAGTPQTMPGMPGGLPGGMPGSLPQMPDTMEGMGMGAMAPQTFNGATGAPTLPGGMSPQAGQQPAPGGEPGSPGGLRLGLLDQFFKSMGGGGGYAA